MNGTAVDIHDYIVTITLILVNHLHSPNSLILLYNFATARNQLS